MIALKARWLFPIAAPPIADGVLTISGGRIAGVGRKVPAGAELIDLSQQCAPAGGAAIIPGLVNAHTHLEFSGLTAPLGSPGMPLPDWIRLVVEHRQADAGAKGACIVSGLAESLRAGTTTIGEIATPPVTPRPYADAKGGGVLFLESLGLSEERITAGIAASQEHLAAPNRPGGFLHGLSPHAPYSTHWSLFIELCRTAAARRAPLAMHLAESAEELEYVHSGGGPFKTMLQDFGVWQRGGAPAEATPWNYLQQLAAAPRALAVHGNYFGRKEIALLASQPSTMSVVYCPRTHRFFGHPSYPLGEMLSAGVRVAVGTDSRASNPDLSLLAELREIARRHSEIPLSVVLRMGTLDGAAALGCGDAVGSLEVGKQADAAVVALPPSNEADPHALLLHHPASVVAVYQAGRRAV